MYSDGNVKTEILDPQAHRSFARTVFNLDSRHGAYLTNLRLTNLGFFGTNTNSAEYNRLVGVYGMIKSIVLFDGKTELSRLNNVATVLGFKAYNTPHSKLEASNRLLSKSEMGKALLGRTIAAEVPASAPIRIGNRLNGAHNKAQDRICPATEAASTTLSGWLNLRDCLPLLKNMAVLHTDIFPNLQLQIEYENNVGPLITDTRMTGRTQLQPQLVVDVVQNEGLRQQLKGALSQVVWNEVEGDRFLVSGVGTGAAANVQTTQAKLNGFNSKVVGRMYVLNSMQGDALNIDGNSVLTYGRFNSPSMVRQACQFRVNGKNKIPRNGLTKPNQRLSLVTDTFGDCASVPCQNYMASAAAGRIDVVDKADDGNNYHPMHDTTGLFIGERVEDLQIEYKRTTVNDSTTALAENADLIVEVFAEVRKMLSFSNGAYDIGYM